ncbi:MAG: purine-binding chemotaxis protein CheW [Deltaproteobacteria bacterium]|nr:purine-binding chemotaxis protein CheW [Deltaproteobacteria bacterium]
MAVSSKAEDLARWRLSVLDTLREDAGAKEDSIPEAAPLERLEVLAFAVGSETYGVRIEEVSEILLPRPVTALPGAPAFVRGLVSLRGTMLPVIDMAARLRLSESQPLRTSRIVVLRDGEERMGFWVDRVMGVIRFAGDEVESTEFAASVDSEFLRGIGYDRKGTLVAVLSGARLCDFALADA